MKKKTIVLAIFAISVLALGIYWVLKSENALVVQPKGMIAKEELELISTNILLMLVIIVPTFIWLLVTAWRYHSQNEKASYEPDKSHGVLGTMMMWTIPSIIVAVMSVITWDATHKLDPFKPLESEQKTLTIQVVAIDWKWLFIYPEQGIATLNFVQFPDQTPIRFALAADGSPMNSFWIPELSGQIYAMSGMITQLHVIADKPGVYRGRACEINGEGYADMTFTAKSCSRKEFEAWVEMVKESPHTLTNSEYNTLLQRTKNLPITLYSNVEKGIFDKIVMKPMHM